MSSNFGSVPKFVSSADARKTFWLKSLLSSRSGDDCCVIRPLVRGLWLNTLKSSTVIKIIDTWFHGAGFQQYIFLDSGPQFGAAKFKNYCKEHYITPLVSSACFPQSNDLAESAVTSAKYLLLKSENYTDFFLHETIRLFHEAIFPFPRIQLSILICGFWFRWSTFLRTMPTDFTQRDVFSVVFNPNPESWLVEFI
jgi:hypothetical protein